MALRLPAPNTNSLMSGSVETKCRIYKDRSLNSSTGGMAARESSVSTHTQRFLARKYFTIQRNRREARQTPWGSGM